MVYYISYSVILINCNAKQWDTLRYIIYLYAIYSIIRYPKPVVYK